MRIAIINQPLANRGDESAHKAFVRTLAKKFQNDIIDVILLENNPNLIEAIKVEAENVTYKQIKINKSTRRFQRYSFLIHNFYLSLLDSSLNRFYKYLKTYDKVICAPGGMCLGGFMSWNHLWQLTCAKKMKKEIFYWGRSIGPFNSESYQEKTFKAKSYELLNYFSYISLRDSVSVKLAETLNLKFDEIVDSAFLDINKIRIPDNIQKAIGEDKYIVYVPNELTWHVKYRTVNQEKIDGFYLSILNLIQTRYPDYKIVMLPQTYESVINDSNYFERLAKKTSANLILVDENQSSDIQQTIISGSKLVIGARYHSIVFAINNNVPFVALSYEHKIKGLLEKLNLGEYMVDIQDIFTKSDNTEIEKCLANVKKLLNQTEASIDRNVPSSIVNTGFNNLSSAINGE